MTFRKGYKERINNGREFDNDIKICYIPNEYGTLENNYWLFEDGKISFFK